MTTPLYKDHNAPKTKPADANTGLWYDKFCNQWCRDKSKEGLKAWNLETFEERIQKEKGKNEKVNINPKLDWIKTVIEESKDKAIMVGDACQLKQTINRITNLLEHHKQTPLFYKLESDFVTGLGLEHPVENGFAWHHTLGTPYLPGSSVKGMVRAWAEGWGGANKADVQRIFGSDDPKNPCVASVIFLDALPSQPVRLKTDIMTPHYSTYYQDSTGKTPPADWDSPIPIPFLVVEKNQGFIFGILPRREDKQSQNDCETVRNWLQQALCWTGAGAKTAVGYGRFTVDKEALINAQKEQAKREQKKKEQQEAKQKEQAIAEQTQGKSELYADLFKEIIEKGWSEATGKNSFVQMGVIENWLDKLESDPQLDAANELARLLNIHFSGLLQNPNAVKGKKAKPVYSDRQKKIAQRLLVILEKSEQ